MSTYFYPLGINFQMETLRQMRPSRRYRLVTEEKAGGATYTPKILADFVAQQMTQLARDLPTDRPLRILDPAIGHGELLVSLLEHLHNQPRSTIEVHGFETDSNALATAAEHLRRRFLGVSFHFKSENFLEFVLERFSIDKNRGNDLTPILVIQPLMGTGSEIAGMNPDNLKML